MSSLCTRFCVGCGYVFDELLPSDRGHGWIAAEAYREKYGFSLDRLHLVDDVCPPCARVFAIGRQLSRPEPAGKMF